jgi:hypothetical protein
MRTICYLFPKANNLLFVSQKEAKIMQNGLHFASISHEAKKNLSEKGTPYLAAVTAAISAGT